MNTQEPTNAQDALNDVALNDLNVLIQIDKDKAAINAAIDALKSDLRALEDRRKVYEEALTESWIETGVKQVKQAGHTISLRRDTYASIAPEFKLEAPRVFMAEGLSHMLTVNGQLLRSYVVAHERAGKEIDEAIKPLVKVSEVYTLRTTPSHKDNDTDKNEE